MKHIPTSALILAITAPVLWADVPGNISYQGRVTDSAGALIGETTPVNRKVIFRIWDSSSSAVASGRIWSEEHTVTIFNGDFSVILGSGAPLTNNESRPDLKSVFTGASRFMEITVDNGDNTWDANDQPIAPRQQITSSAFALQAGVAQTVDALTQPDGVSSRFNWVSARNVTIDGHTKINGGNILEFGAGLGKETSAGTIGYNAYSDGLDIVGAGTSFANRKLTLWAEGGTSFKGGIDFGHRFGQHINLWGDLFGIGASANTLFNRSSDRFEWIRGGNGSSGGTVAAVLDGNGFFTSGAVRVGGGASRPANGLTGGAGTKFILWGGEANRAPQAFGVDINTTWYGVAPGQWQKWYEGTTNTMTLNPGGNLAVSGGIQLGGNLSVGGDRLRLGTNRAGQEENAGVIAYKAFTQGLDIVGAGVLGNLSDRMVTIHAQGGCTVLGPLDVPSFSNQNIGGFTFFARSGTGNSGGPTGTVEVSIKASNRMVASEFNATSDARIKKVVGQSDSSKDLSTLLKVKITDYSKIEDQAKTPRPHKKVIAQELEEIFPQAVNKMPGHVPDVFAAFTAKAGLITLKQPLKVALKAGDVLKAYLEKAEPGKDEISVTVASLTKDGVQLAEKLDGNLFIYGHKVEDLRTVDYEAIAMLNVSATQELNRTITTQAAELKQLREEKAALQKELTEANQAQDRRLAALEKMISTQSSSKLSAPATAVKTSR